MAKAKTAIKEQVIAPASVPEPKPEIEIQEEVTIDNTVLLENIFVIRFVDTDGRLYRLDGIPGHARGDYRLYPA